MRLDSKVGSLSILLLLSFVWATVFLAIKIGDQTISPLALSFDRALIAFVTLLPFALYRYLKQQKSARSFSAAQLICCAVVGAIIAYLWLVISIAEQVISSGVAALFTSSVYLSSWLLSVIIIRSKPFYWIHLLGIIIATLGLAGAVGIDHIVGHADQLKSILLFVSGFFAFAISAILSNKFTSELPVMEVTTLNLFFATLCLFLIGVFHLMPWHQSGALLPVLSVLWAGVISTGFGYYLYYDLLVKAGPLFANCFGYFVPVFGLLLSVFFMGMPITLFQVLSIPLLLFGIFLLNLKLTK